MEKPHTVLDKEKVKEAIQLFYELLGLQPDQSRRLEQNIARQAIANCLLFTGNLQITTVSKLLGRHHSTILHYRKKHEANLASWHDYARHYNLAVRVVAPSVAGSFQSQINYIDYQIEKLQEQKQELLDSLKLAEEAEFT